LALDLRLVWTTLRYAITLCGGIKRLQKISAIGLHTNEEAKMICKKQPRELKPGDLFIVTGAMATLSEFYQELQLGEDVFTFKEGRHRLVCRHSCGALEFLILKTAKSNAECDIPMCQDIAS
jgi:hypothetical protein